MRPASSFFSDEERKAVSAAVAEAESRTSGEIVPVVATTSGRYDRGEDLFGLVVALVALTLAWVFLQEIRPVQGDWASRQTLALSLLPVLIIIIAGFLLGAAVATRFPVLALAFTSRREIEEEVDRRAAEYFHQFRVRKTREGTGILIYLSLHERRVRIMGDETIGEKLSQEDWEAVRDTIARGIRDRRPAEGLRQGILKSGDLLEKHFSIRAGDANEISDEIHIID